MKLLGIRDLVFVQPDLIPPDAEVITDPSRIADARRVFEKMARTSAEPNVLTAEERTYCEDQLKHYGPTKERTVLVSRPLSARKLQ